MPLTSHSKCLFGHGYLAVDMFFPLSGFVMALNYSKLFTNGLMRPDYLRFLIRRLARIYPMYFVSLVAASVLVHFNYISLWGAPFGPTLWSNLLLVQNWGFWASMDYPAWSLSAELLAYLLFPLLLFWIFRSEKTMWIAFICFGSTLASLTTFSYLHGGGYKYLYGGWPRLLNMGFGPLSLIRCVAEFGLGITVYRIKFTRFGSASQERGWIIYGILFLIFCLLTFPGTDLLIALLCPWFILLLDGKATLVSRLLGWRPIEYVGLLSFSLYLIHPLMTPLIDGLSVHLRYGRVVHTHTFSTVLIIPVLFLCSAASYYGIEIPGRRLIRNLFERPKLTA